MAQSSALLAVLTVVMLAACCGSCEAKKDLHRFCLRLEDQLSSNKDASSDADAAFREARKYMRSFLHLGSAARLAKAWETVIRDEPCAKNRADIVNTIAECNPNSRGSLATLHAAVRRYSMKCLTPAFWDEQLDKTLGSSDKSGLTNFMDRQFLAKYHEENPNERKLHFATIGGPNCCQPERSQMALLHSLGRILAENSKQVKSSDQVARTDRKRLETIMDKHLFRPCEKYLNNVRELMWAASRAAYYHIPNDQAFVDGLSPKFQAALFRYKYCNEFHLFDNAVEKMTVINMDKFSV